MSSRHTSKVRRASRRRVETLLNETFSPAGLGHNGGPPLTGLIVFPVSTVNTLANSTGGTITTAGGYRIHTFTGSGTFVPSGAGQVEYLVVAGGGPGGSADAATRSSGGGGGGGVRTGSLAVKAGSSLTVTIGAGGTGPAPNAGNGANGSNSVFGSITATGGGAGGSLGAAVGTGQGAAGGSGGGNGRNITAPVA